MQLRLVRDPVHAADRGQQALGQRPLAIADRRIGEQRADALADRGRRVRHRPNDRRAGAEGRLEAGRQGAGGDRQDQRIRAADHRLVGRQRRRHHLRLDREQHHFRPQIGRQGCGLGQAVDAGCRQAAARLGGGLDRPDIGRRDAARQPASEQRPAHLAAADQDQGAGQSDGQASPSVSSMAALSASAGGLPPKITNWKAG